MKKIFIACLSAASLFAVCIVSAQTKVKVKVKTNVRHDGDGWGFGGSHVPGTWVAYIEDQKVHIDFTGEDWNTGRTFLLSDLGTLPGSTEGSFKLSRESGTVTFKGEFEGGKGRGFYSFVENPGFKSYLEEKGYSGLDKEIMLDIFFTDINKGYFDFLKEHGYAPITNENLKDLAQQDLNRKVMEDYFGLFKTESWGHPALSKVIELREHGVNARFVNSFHTMGFKQNVPLDNALELRDHGVTPEFITSIQKMGYENITLERATELRDHGVNPEFIHSIQDMGYKGITLEKAQELRDHGVNPEFIRSISDLGFKNLTLDKAQELRDHGVNAEFIKKMRGKKGVKVETLDDYIRLRDTGFNE